jgi:hypothetical protein
MPLPDTQIRECLAATGEFISKRRPPPEIRDKLDFRAAIEGQEVILFSIRPAYDDESRNVEFPIAEARWVEKRKIWKLYWMRADLKWHSYQPLLTLAGYCKK